jgi:hypothetical protein
MKQLIQDVQKRLADATLPPPSGDTSNPMYRKSGRLFEYVDVDWGQADFYSSFPPPIKFPAALIDVTSATYSNEGRLTQVGIVDVQVRIVDLVLGNTSYQAPESMRQAAYRTFDHVSAANRLLHGWTSSDHYGTLTRVSMAKVNRPDGLREYRLTYRVQLTDVGAVRVAGVTPAKPKLTAKLVPVGE